MEERVTKPMEAQAPKREQFVSDADLAIQTLGVLRQFDVDIQAAKLERNGEGKTDTDEMPSQGMTYGERIARLEERQASIVADNAAIMPVVRELRTEAAEAQRLQRVAAVQQAKQAQEALDQGATVVPAPPTSPLPQVP